ncbi:MAG: hypothetical protein HY902_13940, partial [Deltaproteobacteria bacterium]|nr:hypothetical protein [Deltaproteobacteria bacterium]
WDLAIRLQPLRPAVERPEALAVPLRPLAKAYQKRQYAKVCQASRDRWQLLMTRAAKIFYAPDRAAPDVDAIERFMNEMVLGPRPQLAVGAERFVAFGTWKALAIDACLRAHRGGDALVFAVGEPAGASMDAALAVALAARAESWAAADLPVRTESLRAALLRALRAPEQAATWLKQAQALARQAEDRELIDAVAGHLGRGTP